MLIGKKSFIEIDVRLTPDPKTTTPMFTPSLPTSPLPGRADSQESEDSSHAGSNNTFFSAISQPTSTKTRVQTVEPNKNSSRGGGGSVENKHHPNSRLSSSDASTLCFSVTDDESQDSTAGSDEGGVVATMLNYLNLSNLFRGPSPNDERGFDHNHPPLSKGQYRIPLLTPQDEHRSPQKRNLSMSKSFTYGSRGKHSKTPSWHGLTDHEWEKEQFMKSIRLPIALTPVHLRIQDFDLDKLKSIWDIHEYNDVFVHPSSLPELFHSSRKKESYLVLLSVPTTPSKMKSNDAKHSETGSAVPSSVATPNSRQTASHLPEKPKRDDERMQKVISRLAEYEVSSPTVNAPSPTPTHASPESFTTNTVVCHLHFATTVQFNNKRKRTSTITLEEISVSREGSTSPTLGHSPSRQMKLTGYLPILPNHLVMSDLVRQQLGVKAGSLVKVIGCQDNWRVNCKQCRVSVYLHPIVKKVKKKKSLLDIFLITVTSHVTIAYYQSIIYPSHRHSHIVGDTLVVILKLILTYFSYLVIFKVRF